MTPLRIVQINTVDVAGGAAKVARKLHEKFRERGHSSTLVVGWKQSSDPDVVEIDNRDAGRGFRGRALRILEARGRQYLDHPGSHRVPALVGGDWDVMHAHNLHGGYFDLAALADLSRRAPLVLTMHDMWLVTGHCGYSCGCNRWQIGCGSCPDLTLYPAIPRDATMINLRRKAHLLGDLDLSVTSPARWALDLAQRSYFRSMTTRHIPNPVDTRFFRPGDQSAARAALGLPGDRPIVLLPARLAFDNEYKAAWMLEEAVKALRDRNVLGVAFGAKDAEPHEGLRILAESFDEARIAEAYRAADVVVYPSRAETSPLAIVEALATERPVVATDVGGVSELLDDGRNGLVVKPGDATGFARAVRTLIDSSDLARRLAQAGFAEVRERNDLDHVVDAWLAFYEELRDGFGRPRESGREPISDRGRDSSRSRPATRA
jgi:glycosyltransferase involved in cell wall biosynthesis